MLSTELLVARASACDARATPASHDRYLGRAGAVRDRPVRVEVHKHLMSMHHILEHGGVEMMEAEIDHGTLRVPPGDYKFIYRE